MEFRRRIYRRGSSFETTIPMPLLLALDGDKQYDCCFAFDPEKQVWQVRFEERSAKEPGTTRPVRSRGASRAGGGS